MVDWRDRNKFTLNRYSFFSFFISTKMALWSAQRIKKNHLCIHGR